MKESIKEVYAGLDVSLKSVSICVSDEEGNILWRGEVVNEPSGWTHAGHIGSTIGFCMVAEAKRPC